MSPSEPAATITPRPDALGCEKLGCEASELLALVEPDDVDEAQVLCPTHRVAYLREVHR